MPLFKKSISDELSRDLTQFAEKEKNQLYLRKDTRRDMSNLMVIGLSTGSALTLTMGSMLAYVTQVLPLNVVQSHIQLGIIPASVALSVSPIMKLYDKIKNGSANFSHDNIKKNDDYAYDYQKLSIFKERIASNIQHPLKDDKSPYMTETEIREEGRKNMYHSFAAGVTGTMLLSGGLGMVTDYLTQPQSTTILSMAVVGLSLTGVSPVLNLMDKAKEIYKKSAIKSQLTKQLAQELDSRIENTSFITAPVEDKVLQVEYKMLPAFVLSSKKPSVLMNDENFMSRDDILDLMSNVKSKYAQVLPAIKPANIHSDEYVAIIENEINVLIDKAVIKDPQLDAHVFDMSYTKREPLSTLVLAPAMVQENIVKDNLEGAELTSSDLFKFVTKINETYQALPEVKKRQIPNEVFIFEEPELIDKPSSLNQQLNEIDITIPKELKEIHASAERHIDLPVLSVEDTGFKVKEGDSIKQFFKNYINKQQESLKQDTFKHDKIVANRHDRVIPRVKM
jgi:hypothetical protein